MSVIDDEVSKRLALAHTTLHVGRDAVRTHSEECNRVDWRSTLGYAATAKGRWERDIVRLLTLRKWVGTAFGTARLLELSSSADDASLFRSVRPFHHRRDGEKMVQDDHIVGQKRKFQRRVLANVI